MAQTLAFIGCGTTVFVDGLEVSGVTHINLKAHSSHGVTTLFMRTLYDPADAGQARIFERMQDNREVRLQVDLPNGHSWISDSAVSGKVMLPADKICRLAFHSSSPVVCVAPYQRIEGYDAEVTF